jgi:hypothetical protein
MPSQVPTHYAQQFASTLALLLQQGGSRIRGAVQTGSHVGEQASPVDQYGAIVANKVVGRYNPMPNTEAPTDRRWVLPTDYDVNQLLDGFDKLRLLNDPMSVYVQNAVNALGRSMDSEIITQFFGNNQTGKSGGTATAFGAGQTVSVIQGAAAATNLTVAKLREARRILMMRNVDLSTESLYIAVNATAHDALLAEVQVISRDFNEVPVLVSGKLNSFLGYNFIVTELVTTGTDDQSGTSTALPVWVKSGVYMGIWSDIKTDVSERNDLQGLPMQAYAKATFGATRLEENKCVRIWAR